MAAKKKSTVPLANNTPSKVPPSARAYEHGREAFGAETFRDGFAVNADLDWAFALGYPHVVTLHASDDDSDAALHAEIARSSGSSPTRPSALAERLVRLLFFGLFDDGTGKDVLVFEGKDRARRGAVDSEEARALIRSALRHDSVQVNHLHAMFLLEAVMGPEVLLRIVTDELCALSDAELLRDGGTLAAPFHAMWVGFGLLRSPRAHSLEMRSRLEARLDAVMKAHPRLSGGAGELWAVLRPEDRARALRNKVDPRSLIHVLRSPELIAKVLSKTPKDEAPSFDARLAFLGGDAVLSSMLAQVPRLKGKDARREAGEIYGQMTSPIASAIVAALQSGKGKAR